MQNYIGALDLGTTSCRFVLFDADARTVGWAQKEHRQLFPQPGWVEHDPMEIWDNAVGLIRETLTSTGITGRQVKALGVTNQRETLVVWNRKTGQPYMNAIVWQCMRSEEICSHLVADGGQDRFRDRTGLPVSTYFSGPKLRWVLDHVPEARKGVETGDTVAGTVESWIIWQLTGGPDNGSFVTDVTNASRTLLMNIHSLQWDEEICGILQIPSHILPCIVPSIDPLTWGTTRIDGPMGAEVPICGALGDQQAALVGQACFQAGEIKNTYGTGCFLLLNTGTKAIASRHGLVTTVGYQIRDEQAVYCLEGSIAIAGALVQWLRDNLGIIETSSQIETLARTVADSGGAVVVPAFSGLYAPYWRSDARGVIAGLTRYFHKGHLARAVLEAVAYQTADVLDAMIKDSDITIDSLRVDGGMVVNDLLMQIQADILGIQVVRPHNIETTALGAAGAAGLAVGFWPDLKTLRQNWAQAATWQPKITEARRQSGKEQWHRAIQRSLNWVS